MRWGPAAGPRPLVENSCSSGWRAELLIFSLFQWFLQAAELCCSLSSCGFDSSFLLPSLCLTWLFFILFLCTSLCSTLGSMFSSTPVVLYCFVFSVSASLLVVYFPAFLQLLLILILLTKWVDNETCWARVGHCPLPVYSLFGIILITVLPPNPTHTQTHKAWTVQFCKSPHYPHIDTTKTSSVTFVQRNDWLRFSEQNGETLSWTNSSILGAGTSQTLLQNVWWKYNLWSVTAIGSLMCSTENKHLQTLSHLHAIYLHLCHFLINNGRSDVSTGSDCGYCVRLVSHSRIQHGTSLVNGILLHLSSELQMFVSLQIKTVAVCCNDIKEPSRFVWNKKTLKRIKKSKNHYKSADVRGVCFVR